MNVIGLDELPAYCALSYVWGEPSEGYKIFMDETEMCVTQGLYDTLQHLRLHDDSTKPCLFAVIF